MVLGGVHGALEVQLSPTAIVSTRLVGAISRRLVHVGPLQGVLIFTFT